MTRPLKRAFFARSALQVGPDLLGCLLVRELEGRRLVGRIVEVEAYLGREDAASHAYRGPTPRSRVMFGRPGIAYVYLIYGMHHCLNAVTGPEGVAQAVLIRALQPLAGIEIMQERRGFEDVHWLANGPGRLCQALGISRRLNGHDLTRGVDLWLQPGAAHTEPIEASARVGVRGDAAARAAAWRFYLAGNPYVSESTANQ